MSREVAYFPGCSLKTIDRAYDVSTRLVARDLGLGLVEVEDYACCGAGELKGNGINSYYLPARNLGHLLRQGQVDVMVSCNVCYHELSRAAYAWTHQAQIGEQINDMLRAAGEPPMTQSASVRNTLDYLINHVGLEAISRRVVRPLTGLRVAPYYGCLYHRPQAMVSSVQVAGEHPEHPHFMHDVLRTLGAQVIAHPAETTCCGGKNLLSDEEIAGRLTGRILSQAKAAGAEVLSLMCPKCAGGLDALQPRAVKAVGEGARLPVVYYTQLMAIAFGHSPEASGLREMESGGLTVIQRLMRQLASAAPV